MVEHFLDTEACGSEKTTAEPSGLERVTENFDFCPDLGPPKRGRGRRLVRINRGLYRYGPNGTIYWCRKLNGKNVWKNLQTDDRKRAMALTALFDYAASQNGNHEVEVAASCSPSSKLLAITVGVGQPQPAPVACLEPPTPAPVAGKSGLSLDGLVERCRADSHNLTQSTRDNHEFLWRMAKAQIDFGRDVRDIRLADLRRLTSRLCQEGYAPSTVNDIIFKGLGALFKIALDDEVLDKSPLEKLNRVKVSEPEREQPSWEKSQQIVEEVVRSVPETGVIIGFMRNFGVGQAEIKPLHGEHIDVGADVIHFRRKKTGKLFDVPIFPHAKTFIEGLKEEGRLQVGRPVVEWRNPRKALESACKDLGLPHYSPRALRRCFIIHCLETGIDARVVAQWQAHADTTLIFRVYGKHISKDHALKMAEKLQ